VVDASNPAAPVIVSKIAEGRTCSRLLYRHVRHPGYLGMLVSLVAFPLVLGSYWSFIPAVLGVAVLVLRTALEDRYLTDHLEDYAEYAARTRWRLIAIVFQRQPERPAGLEALRPHEKLCGGVGCGASAKGLGDPFELALEVPVRWSGFRLKPSGSIHQPM
ncbi:MAG TPA: isoprenylcysteine carboxylmethyltransferase family protein, partial [Myxococcaceae bacterium]|nr:isoprenylcysteine carboxylmethyltransferase family protein [Myxococcaceae bacterium]